MSQQLAVKIGKNIPWLDFLDCWIYTRRTLEEKLENVDSVIINVVSIVRAIWRDSSIAITWDGTSKCVYHGVQVSTIAGKQTIIDTLEIQLKRENIIGLDTDLITSWGYASVSTLDLVMTEKSRYALTLSEVQANLLTAILTCVGDSISLCLELPRPQSE